MITSSDQRALRRMSQRSTGDGRSVIHRSLTPDMTIYHAMSLLAAGIGGGIAGTMASVASVVSYPALLALGLPPLAANVTNTMSMIFAVPGAVLGSRPELSGQR